MIIKSALMFFIEYFYEGSKVFSITHHKKGIYTLLFNIKKNGGPEGRHIILIESFQLLA